MFDYWSRKLWDSQQSLELLVSEQCNLDQQERMLLFKNHVEIVSLELSKHCNRKCNYCPVSHSSRQSEQEIIDRPLFERIVKDLAQISYSGTISLNLYNEPLLNPELISHIQHIRQSLRRSYIGFNSNGDSLNASKLSSLADAGLNYICVTLHPKPDTVISEEETLRRTTMLLGKIGHTDMDALDIAETVKTSSHLLVSLKGVDIRIQWPDWNLLGGSRGGDIAVLDLGKPIRTQPCTRPFREFTLYFDGTVTPCCEVFHDGSEGGLTSGRVEAEGDSDIFAIYAGSKMGAFRRSVFDYSEKRGVCKHCPVEDFSNGSDLQSRQAIMDASRTVQGPRIANG